MTDPSDLSGIAGADAGGPSAESTELEELADTIASDGAQGAAAASATSPTEPPAATPEPIVPSGPPAPPPSELVHSASSRTVADTPSVVATGASEAVRHAMSHISADTPAGPRTRARPIFRRPQAGTTHTVGETPAAGDTRAMENRMDTAEPASHVGLGQLAREARGRALARAVGGLGAPKRAAPGTRSATRAKRPEGASRPRPGMGRSSLGRFTRRDR